MVVTGMRDIVKRICLQSTMEQRSEGFGLCPERIHNGISRYAVVAGLQQINGVIQVFRQYLQVYGLFIAKINQ